MLNKNTNKNALSLDEMLDEFNKHGGTPENYLSDHYQRYWITLQEFSSTWKDHSLNRVLDVGAHWLHQSLVWRHAGFLVTAVDLPGTFEVDSVKRLAQTHDILLRKCPDLEQAKEFESFPDNSFDIILFSEIIEHITFNPVKFWTQIHRILSPGGRIIITTPNFYSWKGRAWNPYRYIKGMGGGINVDDILGLHTYAHHWREYTRSEIKRYFELLSPDFTVAKSKTLRTYTPSKKKWKRVVQSILEVMPGVRPNLHVEIQINTKTNGITAKPHW
ncbi:class I SAM-dependent methyltransferase [Rhodanobacter sp. Col0626]|uniref:class I SAM-dependent methyltransferase n=1 Tax=Rhodanobacter sp. Col0626 TaxID=3415679 RepID=UPI003CEAFF25